jgi:signal transduction histidine kinase
LEGGVQQQVVALKLRLGIAAKTAAEEDAGQAAGLLDGMTGDAQAVIEQIRTLARGIFPPLLEAEGLRPALIAVVDQAPVDIEADLDDVGRLARDIEGAIYFTVSEALTNAVKHGESPLRIELRRLHDSVEFMVADAGPGFDPSRVLPGSGLTNLADRVETAGGNLRIESAPGSPTVVAGAIPLS